MQKNDMEIMLRLRCTGCGKCFIVEDDQVETDYLSCPHCQDEIEIPEPDAEGDDEGLQFDFCHQIAVAEPDDQ